MHTLLARSLALQARCGGGQHRRAESRARALLAALPGAPQGLARVARASRSLEAPSRRRHTSPDHSQ